MATQPAERQVANISRGNLATAITNRQAKPLTGIEISEALKTHLLTLSEKMLTDKVNFRSDQIMTLTTELEGKILEEFAKRSFLGKMNVTYPRVGWSVRSRLHRKDADESHFLTAEVELDLQYNMRILIQVGDPTDSIVVCDMEDEKISTSVPDRDRQKFGMPVFVDVNKPDGTVAKVNLAEVQSGPKKAARSVDVGRAALNQIEIILPTDDGPIGISGSADAVLGADIVLPSELPEVTLDHVVATPPPLPMPPPVVAPPVGGMQKTSRPAVKLKR
jgi:hypothetical protein